MRLSPSSLPASAKTYCVSLDKLNGGLNLFEEEGALAPGESPEMKNLIWRDGALASRRGQRLVCELGESGIAAYDRLFAEKAIFHAGDKLFAVNIQNGEKETLYSGLCAEAGSFFLYKGELYYKTRGAYIVIRAGETLSAAEVEAYTPVTSINADPESGAGDIYQPENRLSPRKTVWYNAPEGQAVFHLPASGAEVISVEVCGKEVEYDFLTESGAVTLKNPLSAAEAAVSNGVRITYSKENHDAYSSISDCRIAGIFGGSGRLSIVMAGASAQPDAFFWNGNHTVLDPGYFPMQQYNLCGGEITGFGNQQGMLVIFTREGVWRASFSLAEIDGREYIQMPCAPINSALGCDMPESIRLVENNLVFCNSQRGVFRIQDSTAAYENNLLHISRRVDGTAARPGLLSEADKRCASINDGSRYWLALGQSVYLWDYSVSSYAKPAWFLFTNVNAAAFVSDGEDIYFISPDGRVGAFYDGFTDFGEGIEREYRFAAMSLGGYERLKDVEKIILTVSSTTDSRFRIEYISDISRREDQTPIRAYSWRLAPRSLGYRMLSCLRWSQSAVRRPACRHIRNFSMRIFTSEPGQDMRIISAKIFFKYRALER